MAKKKKLVTDSSKPKPYAHNPFNQLKGFAVSDTAAEVASTPARVPEKSESESSFAAQMNFLGVDQLHENNQIHSDPEVQLRETPSPGPELSEDESFVAAVGSLDVSFADDFPREIPQSAPRRLKQVKQGRITPDASLDLHGLQRYQVAEKIKNFLQDARYQGWRTLIIVTGRGLHSLDGQTVLRDEAERYLQDAGKPWVAEWYRAPRQYGGEGALVIFLKKHDSGE